MSNLGAYETIVKLSKKVGGPKVLVGLIALGGYSALRFCETGIKRGAKAILKKFHKTKEDCAIYQVVDSCEYKNGLMFEKGDSYKVLERDDDVVLIEKIGDANNPHIVTFEFLARISDIAN